MPERSWNSAVVRFIDRDAVNRDLRQAVAEARARYPEIIKVYLFGSFVQGTWTADSDADLIVVVRKRFTRFSDSVPYQIYCPSVPVDSLVYSEDDFNQMMAEPESFVAQNVSTAMEL